MLFVTVSSKEANETNSCTGKALPAMALACHCRVEHYTAVLPLIKAAVLGILKQLYKLSAGRHAGHLEGIAERLTSWKLTAGHFGEHDTGYKTRQARSTAADHGKQRHRRTQASLVRIQMYEGVSNAATKRSSLPACICARCGFCLVGELNSQVGQRLRYGGF